MKLSIAWIFSHIDADYTQYDIMQLAQKFNITTAEIEHVEKLECDIDKFTLAQVSQINSDLIVLHSRELNQSIELPYRDDCISDYFYMLVKDNNDWQWARMRDWKSGKDGLLPAFSCTDPQCVGSWKKMLDGDDYIFNIDNKSITHRPDLWSHRGFAREIAAILDISLCDEQTIYAAHQIAVHERRSGQTTGNPFSFELQDSEYCKRFAALYIPNIGHYASWIWMAQRLCKIDIKPIDALVDATNYVMLDIGQPLHAFDAEKIKTHYIVSRLAHESETLPLLDGQIIELTDQDIVITDGKRPISLGGVMGGNDTAINHETRSILVEAANFDAATVRRTAQRFKLRTDASSRFEKSLDPNLNVLGLLRFLKILEQHNIPLIAASEIVSLGKAVEPYIIEISHAKLEQFLGVSLSQDFVQKTLIALEFTVKIVESKNQYKYCITVPTFRSTKDVRLAEDIIEEIGRFYGFGNIPKKLPKLELKPHSLRHVMRLRKVKEFMAESLQAREVRNYAFYDEAFLQELQWEPEDVVTVINPVSHNWKRLVTSLVPHLLRAVIQSGTHNEQIRFFEWSRIWKREDTKIIERKSLAGIIYDKKALVDFYWAKDQLERLFDLLDILVTWTKYDGTQAWYHPYKTATLYYKNGAIGYVGLVNTSFMHTILEGHACIFEISGDVLLTAKREQKEFKPLSKYQDAWFDVSMFVPLEVTVIQITNTIKNVNDRIVSVDLIDFFEKVEWVDKRSVTMRIIIQDPDKTLVKKEIDTFYTKVIQALEKCEAVIR